MPADTVSSGLQLLLMTDGLHNNDWGDQLNVNLTKIESAATGLTHLTVSGGSYTLSDDEARAAILNVTGSLGTDQALVVPSRPKLWVVNSAVTGGSLIIQTAVPGSKLATLKAGVLQQVFCDGSNVYRVNVPPSETGIMKMYAGATIPDDYIICDGRSVSRVIYSDLFAKLGTTWGVGDGSSTFNVPDMRGRVPAGPDAMGSSPASRVTHSGSTALGAAIGEEQHTLSTGEIPNHNHTLTDPGHNHSVNDPGHTHQYNQPADNLTLTGTAGVTLKTVSALGNTTSSTTGISNNATTTGVSIAAVGGGGAHNNMQPTAFINFIIHI
jgi:microcystin-dependent protein